MTQCAGTCHIPPMHGASATVEPDFSSRAAPTKLSVPCYLREDAPSSNASFAGAPLDGALRTAVEDAPYDPYTIQKTPKPLLLSLSASALNQRRLYMFSKFHDFGFRVVGLKESRSLNATVRKVEQSGL